MRWLLALVIACSLARPARADLAGTLYGDVRDVIEDLIQTEVTQSVVNTIKDKNSILAFYMHGTLERLASPYWGSLHRVLKDDLTVVISDFVYWHLSTGGGDGDIVGSAKQFFSCAKAGAQFDPAGCKRLLGAIQGQKRPLLEVECRRAKPTPDRRIACHVGLAVLAALKGRGEVRQHLVDALAEIVLFELEDNNTGSRMRDILTKWMDLPKDLPTPLIEALANPDLAGVLTDDSLDKRCSNPEEIKRAIDNPTGPLSWLCFAVTHKQLELILAADVTVKENGHTIHHVVQHWELEAAIRELESGKTDEDVALRVFADLAWEKECPLGKEPTGPCAARRLQPGAQVTVRWLRREFTARVTGNRLVGIQAGALTAPMFKFRKLAQRIQELRELVPPSLKRTLFYAGQTVSPDTRRALRAAHRMARLVTELRARWYLWSSDKKSFEDLDIAELLNVARASLDQTTIATNSALAFLDKQAVGGGTLDIGDWLRMVMRADYRSLAMESLRVALDLELKQSHRLHETFFLSLASYLLDTSDNVGESMARSAFRASAKELLLSAQHRGVPKPGDRFRFEALPRLALKLSFNDTYAATDGDSRRKVVAADWPTAMVAINDYVGFEVSVLDLLAPLAEMALRPPGTYRGYGYVALDLIRPRAGMWISAPQISRRVALTGGFGARLLDVKRTDDGTGALTADYGYKPSLTFDAGIQFVF